MNARKCENCNVAMADGYYVADNYYCSDFCLKNVFTENEIKDFEIGEDDSENYWTEWEDD